MHAYLINVNTMILQKIHFSDWIVKKKDDYGKIYLLLLDQTKKEYGVNFILNNKIKNIKLSEP